MNRYEILIYFILIVLMSISCDNSQPLSSEDNLEDIYQDFHGKYEIVSSVSDRPVDVNQDGEPSINLVEEIRDLSKTQLEIRIIKDSYTKPEPLFLFLQFWSEQKVSQYPKNAASPTVHYSMQGTLREFSFSEDRTQIYVEQDDENQEIDKEKFPLPDEVTVKGPGEIEVVIKKNIYTTNGWQTVTTTTLYERTSMTAL